MPNLTTQASVIAWLKNMGKNSDFVRALEAAIEAATGNAAHARDLKTLLDVVTTLQINTIEFQGDNSQTVLLQTADGLYKLPPK